MNLPARLLATVAAVTAVTFGLSGCLVSFVPDSASSTQASATPNTDGIAADLLPFYEQELSWSDCGDGASCADVTAPLDWDDPSAGTIELAIMRYAATDGSSLGSLLTNPGGPGASGIDFIESGPTTAVSAALAADYDVVGFDPRGVGSSTAVTCYDATQMDEYLFTIPTATRGTTEWEDELRAANADFAAACAQNSGDLLEYVTTVQAARDMDLIRGVLGDATLNYLGYSYGTFLGATYAGLYPERVGRMVLDGAIDPTLSGTEISLGQIGGFESSLRAYLADCLAGSDCPFTGTVDDAVADIQALLASVDRTPLPNADGRELGADALALGIIAALYSEANWPYLTAGFSSVLQGDPSTMFLLVDFYYNRSGGVYGDNSTEAFVAYNCMDYPVTTDEEEAAYESALAEVAPTMAPYWSAPDVCESWPYAPTGERAAITADGAAPIVVVGSTGDPATPYAWAEALADQLSSGVLLTRVGEGHTAYNQGIACIDDAIDDYFIDGTVPEDGLRCG